MGFHLRKSFKLGPIRFNLSNSGLGASIGVKGARVGIDGKGRAYIGGGKGMLRYREYAKGTTEAKENMPVIINEKPSELADTTALHIALVILYIPLILLWLLSFATIKNEPGIFIFFSIILIPLILSCISKTRKRNHIIAKAVESNKKGELQEALNIMLTVEYSKYKTYEAQEWVNNFIFDIYEGLGETENALNFLERHGIISNLRAKKAKCLYKLEKWVELINFLQKEYTYEEKQEHPSYYALLADAFLNNNQKEIALETLLQGPITKRNMTPEMCAFRYSLGKCYEANGDVKNALKQYQKVYSFDAEFEDVSEKINKLTNQG